MKKALDALRKGIEQEQKFWDLVKKGNLKGIKKLIIAKAKKQKKEITSTDDKSIIKLGSTLFDYSCASVVAAAGGQMDILKLLVDIGETRLDIPTRQGFTTLMAACSNWETEIAKYTIEQGADIHFKNKDGESPILCATHAGCIELVELLTTKGVNINTQEKNGDNLLMRAMRCLHPDNGINIAGYLIDNGISINAKNKEGETAVFRAIAEKNYKGFEFLAKRGANLNIKNNENKTLLIKAVLENNLKIAELLLKNGANPDIAGHENQETALIIAAENGNTKMVELLLSYNTDLDYKCNTGDTALFRAVINGHFNIVKLLVESGVDLTITTTWNDLLHAKTEELDAYGLALKTKEQRIARYLKNAKENPQQFQQSIIKNIKNKIEKLSVQELQNISDNKLLFQKVVSLNQWEALLTRLTYPESLPLYSNVKTKIKPAQKKLLEEHIRQKRKHRENA